MTLTEKSGHRHGVPLRSAWPGRREAFSRRNRKISFSSAGWRSALKQRRFPREINPDIEWLLKQRRQLGVSAKSGQQAELPLVFLAPGESVVRAERTLSRLTYATGNSERYALELPSAERLGMVRPKCCGGVSAGVNGIHLSRANLDVAFDDSGRQINPLTARLTGNVVGRDEGCLIAVAGRHSCSRRLPAPPANSLDGWIGSARSEGAISWRICASSSSVIWSFS